MFKNTITRLILISSPVDLFGIRSTADGNNGNNCKAFHHQNWREHNHCVRNRNIQLLQSFSTGPGPYTNPSQPLRDLQQWAISVTKCGIAKDTGDSQTEILCQEQEERNVYGDDACFIAIHDGIYVAGIADGVGGWRHHGVDPSQFSSQLMENCAEIVRSGDFELNRPDQIIARAYDKLKTPAKRPIGSSTACVLIINQKEGKLYAANLGDSGYLIYRDNTILFRSPEQTHYFNAPYQLTLLPERLENTRRAGGFLFDRPENSDLREHELQKGDLILIASDGLWDNVYISKIAKMLADVEPTEASLQARCNALALIARHLSNDEFYESPFTKRALDHGIKALGGKPDDITIVLFCVS